MRIFSRPVRSLGWTVGLVLAVVVAGAPPALGSDRIRPSTQFASYVLDHGRYRAFEAPEPTAMAYAFGINNRGDVAGEYIRYADGAATGESAFLRRPDGRIRIFDYPGAAGTETSRINNHDQIIGTYSDDSPTVNESRSFHGFVYDLHRQHFRSYDVPDSVGDRIGAGISGINDRGDFVGSWTDTSGLVHGFSVINGRFAEIKVPGAAAVFPGDINNRRQLVGTFGDTSGALHGFIIERGQQAKIINVPGAPETTTEDINERGEIVGTISDDLDLTNARGYLLRPGGRISMINFPGAPRSSTFGLNDRGGIVGFYENPNFQPAPTLSARTSGQVTIPWR